MAIQSASKTLESKVAIVRKALLAAQIGTLPQQTCGGPPIRRPVAADDNRPLAESPLPPPCDLGRAYGLGARRGRRRRPRDRVWSRLPALAALHVGSGAARPAGVGHNGGGRRVRKG